MPTVNRLGLLLKLRRSLARTNGAPRLSQCKAMAARMALR
jgi:hypothetical protein